MPALEKFLEDTRTSIAGCAKESDIHFAIELGF